MDGWISTGREEKEKGYDGRPGEVSKENGWNAVHVGTPPWIEKCPNGGDTMIWSSKAGEGGSAPCRHWVLGLGGCRGHAWLPGWDDETRRLDRGLRREPGPGYVEL